MAGKRWYKNHFYMMKVIFKYEWFYFPVLILYIFFNYVTPFILIIYPKYILDSISNGDAINSILRLILIMAASYLIVYLCLEVLSMVKANLEMKLKVKLNISLSEKCMKLKYADLEKAEVLNRINNAKLAVSGGLTYTQSIGLSGEQGISGYYTQISNLVANLLKVVSLLYILGKLQTWVLAIMITGLLFSCVCNLIKRKANIELRNYAAPYLKKNQYCNRILRSFEAGKDIRLYHLESYLLEKFSECNKRYIDAKKEYKLKFVLSDLLAVICSYVVTFCVYISLIYLAVNQMISIGEFTIIASAAITLFSCGTDIIAEVLDLDILSVYMADFESVMCREETAWCGERQLRKGKHTIQFQHVSFMYQGAKEEALYDVNVTIHGGDTISVVGANGAGKSTFVKLLAGLYRPSSGVILIDGYPMEEYKRSSLVKNMSVLFQDFQIYALTVEENVTLSFQGSQPEYEKSIADAGIEKRIEKMSQRGKTPLFGYFNENEEALSGGEAQKLALARIFYRNTDLMILDEPTAALDALAESEIYDCMSEHTEDHTVIFVSHRLASSKFCKRVLVFDKGSIVEEGSHNDLINSDGLYRKMWDAQTQYYNL